MHQDFESMCSLRPPNPGSDPFKPLHLALKDYHPQESKAALQSSTSQETQVPGLRFGGAYQWRESWTSPDTAWAAVLQGYQVGRGSTGAGPNCTSGSPRPRTGAVRLAWQAWLLGCGLPPGIWGTQGGRVQRPVLGGGQEPWSFSPRDMDPSFFQVQYPKGLEH